MSRAESPSTRAVALHRTWSAILGVLAIRSLIVGIHDGGGALCFQLVLCLGAGSVAAGLWRERSWAIRSLIPILLLGLLVWIGWFFFGLLKNVEDNSFLVRVATGGAVFATLAVSIFLQYGENRVVSQAHEDSAQRKRIEARVAAFRERQGSDATTRDEEQNTNSKMSP